MEQNEYLLYINQDMRWMSCLFLTFSFLLDDESNECEMEQNGIRNSAFNSEQMTNTPQNLLC